MNTMYFEDYPSCPQAEEMAIETLIEPSADITSMEVNDIIRNEILSGNTHIHIPEGVKYLSEILDELPKNCIFNKGNTGCGGTSVAICNNENYIVCVPNVIFIKNKLEQAKEWGTEESFYKHEVFGVYNRSEVSDEDIVDYLERNKNNVKKILVTYDSLKRLNDFIDPSEYNILIDEYHTFIHYYIFRNTAITTVLENYNKYQSFTFLSATPIPDEFNLQEFSNIPIVNAVWANPNRYQLEITYCKKGLVAPLVELIKEFLDGSRTGNLYLFINSVKLIEDIINHPELIYTVNEYNCKVVYSQNNVRKLRIKRGFIDSNYMKINFITSTGFEGIDIYDEDGVTVVATNANHKHTLIDISSTLVQIAGRLRRSKYKGKIEVFCKFKTNQNSMSFETYTKLIEIEEKATNDKIELLNEELSGRKYKNKLQLTYLNKEFIRTKDNGLLFLDKNTIKHELYKYHLSKCIYSDSNSLTQEIGTKGIFTIISEKTIEIKDSKNRNPSKNFGIAVDTIRSLDQRTGLISKRGGYRSPESKWDGLTDEEIRTVEDIQNRYPYIWDAIKYLGYDRMAELEYNTSNIKRGLIPHTHKFNAPAIIEHLKFKDLEGSTKTEKEIKKLLQTIYDKLGLKKTAKATEIQEFYCTKKAWKNGSRAAKIGTMKKLL